MLAFLFGGGGVVKIRGNTGNVAGEAAAGPGGAQFPETGDVPKALGGDGAAPETEAGAPGAGPGMCTSYTPC